jgi:hypothetical protein
MEEKKQWAWHIETAFSGRVHLFFTAFAQPP